MTFGVAAMPRFARGSKEASGDFILPKDFCDQVGITDCNERGSRYNTSKSAVQDQPDGRGVAVTSAYVRCSQRQLRAQPSSDSHTCTEAAEHTKLEHLSRTIGG